MNHRPPSSSTGPLRGTGLAVSQATVMALVLLVCLAAPDPARPALLVPLAGRSATIWLRNQPVTVLGSGTIPGSLVVRGASLRLAAGALMAGALLIAVPASLCSPAGRTDR